MINSIHNFIEYFAGVRKRTLNYVRLLPEARLSWSPQVGELTCAELVRHLAASERMFVEVVLQSTWRYAGHAGEQRSLVELLTHLEQTHADAMSQLRTVPDTELEQPRPSLDGSTAVKAWRWLMAMTEHEIHHRSQLAMYLFLLGITPPHIYGSGVEEVIARATG
jgi:uncharacterized damage-inducible protein DinB